VLSVPNDARFTPLIERTGVERSRLILIGQCPLLNNLRWESTEQLRVGRHGGDLDVMLHDPSVSNRHMELVWTPLGWMVRDLGSKTGTLLNGQLVSEKGAHVQQNDRLQVGRLTLSVEIVEPTVPVGAPPAAANGTEAEVENIRASGSFFKVQASTQRSWDQAVNAVADCDEQPPLPPHYLKTLLRAGRSGCEKASLDELLQAILDDAVSTLDAQRGAIVLVDESTGNLQLRAVRLMRDKLNNKHSYSRTLAERSFRRGESLLCEDVHTDQLLLSAGSVAHGAMASIICALLRSPRGKLGVLHLDRGPLQDAFTAQDLHFADALAAAISGSINSAQLAAKQNEQFIQTVAALGRVVEIRDNYTANHTNRVTEYALLLAQELRLPATTCYLLQIGTPLHDIGKIGVDDAVLRKPGALTSEEYEHMKTHTLKGAAILGTIPALIPFIPIARHHHERWDGTGYPDQLMSERISLVARIVAVADAFDAMTSDRPYRKALPLDRAFAELASKAGTHFDPVCVNAFLALRPRIEVILKQKSAADQATASALYALLSR
jgi:HD-GYP domain-containing protein (c-di-GMP phosphodiesterase class II)